MKTSQHDVSELVRTGGPDGCLLFFLSLGRGDGAFLISGLAAQ